MSERTNILKCICLKHFSDSFVPAEDSSACVAPAICLGQGHRVRCWSQLPKRSLDAAHGLWLPGSPRQQCVSRGCKRVSHTCRKAFRVLHELSVRRGVAAGQC